MSAGKSVSAGVGALVALAMLLTGCGAAPEIGSAVTTQGAVLHGTVHGGQQPVSGAHIHVLGANTGGYGTGAAQASVDLFTSSFMPTETLYGVSMRYVSSGGDGSFSITSAYSCTSGQVVYLLVTGGNPGLSGTVNNGSLALLAVLGTCPATGSFAATVPDVNVNEVTTVAAGYALSGFLGDPAHLSYSGTALALTGLQNAAANAGNLVNLATGTAYATTPGTVSSGITGTVPAASIDVLANTLASCVNSNGALTTTSGSSAVNTNCGNLFAYATSDGTTTGTQPGDTAMALLNIARNPNANVSNLYGLGSTTQPYPTTLSAAPGDWSLGIQYTCSCFNFQIGGGNFASLAIGANGHVWIGNTAGKNLFELTGVGTLVAGEPAAGYSTDSSEGDIGKVSIDGSGNVWYVDDNPFSPGDVFKLSGTGTSASSKAYSPLGGDLAGGLGGGLAVDGSGNVWVGAPGGMDLNTNTSFNSVVELNSGGNLLSGEPSDGYASSKLSARMSDVAIDDAGNVWSASPSSLVEITGLPSSPVYTSRGGSAGYGFAIDGSGNVWTGTQGAPAEITGPPGSSVTYRYPDAASNSDQVAIDGAGVAWFTGSLDSQSNSLVVGIGGTPSSPTYKKLRDFQSGASIAVTGSGDLWMAGEEQGQFVSMVVQMIGAATPVVTPITPGSATTTGKLGVRP